MWSEHSAQDFTTIFTGFQRQPVPHGDERHEAVFLDNSRSAVLQVKSTGKNNTSISEPLDNVSVVWNWPGLLARLKPHRGKCHLLCNHILLYIFSAFCLHAAHQLKQKLTALTLSVLEGALKMNYQVGTMLPFGMSWGCPRGKWTGGGCERGLNII